MLLTAGGSTAAGQAPQPGGAPVIHEATPDDDTIEAGEADAEVPRRRLIRWNEYEGPFFTFTQKGQIIRKWRRVS